MRDVATRLLLLLLALLVAFVLIAPQVDLDPCDASSFAAAACVLLLLVFLSQIRVRSCAPTGRIAASVAEIPVFNLPPGECLTSTVALRC